jgi:uncharacterized protein
MSERSHYPAGVPCWVDTLQPDPRAALDFYGPLFGWDFAGPALMPGDPPGDYFVARVRGRDVAGIGLSPAPSSSSPSIWNTYVRVDSVGEAIERVQKAGGALVDGPVDVLPAGRLAVVSDLTGAVVGVWEARAREGAQVLNEPGAWAMSLLHTTDPSASTAFYGAVFGWQAEPFEMPGAQVTLWRLPGYVGGEPQQPVPRDVVSVMTQSGSDGSPSDVPPHWSVDFWVHDADATAEHAARLGGQVVVPPYDVPGFRSAVLADPEGATFTVSKLTAVP